MVFNFYFHQRKPFDTTIRKEKVQRSYTPTTLPCISMEVNIFPVSKTTNPEIRRVEMEWHEYYCVTIGWKGGTEPSAHEIVRSSTLLNWTSSVHKLAQVHKQLR